MHRAGEGGVVPQGRVRHCRRGVRRQPARAQDPGHRGGERPCPARLLLSDWLVILTSRFNHETGVARFDPKDAAAVDGAFTSCVPLQQMPRMVFALLRSTMLRPRGVQPDERTRARALARRLDPPSLSRLLYPRLSSYADVDTQAFPRHSLTRTAVTTSNGAVFLVDAFDVVVVFYAPAQPGSERASLPYPPPQGSAVRAAVNALREEREVTPGWCTYAAVRRIRPRSTTFSSRSWTWTASRGASGFVGFLHTVESQARRFARGVKGRRRVRDGNLAS